MTTTAAALALVLALTAASDPQTGATKRPAVPVHPMLLDPCYAQRAELLASGATWAGFGAGMALGGAIGFAASAVATTSASDEGTDTARTSLLGLAAVYAAIAIAGLIIAEQSRDTLRLYSVTECPPRSPAVRTIE